MKAIDTNVVLRFLMDDDPVQSPVARAIIGAGVFVPLSIMLEIGWVLASHYKLGRAVLTRLIDDFLDVPTITVEDEPALRRAIQLYRGGADWGDAIHLAAVRGSTAFVTFDRRLASVPSPLIPIELAEA